MTVAAPLRGASAEALTALSDRAAHTHALADAAEIGQDLFGVADLLRSEPALRRVLTDNSVDAEARAGLATSVLQGKIGEHALDVVTDAVSRRWTKGSDLTSAVAQVAAVSVVRSAGAAGGRKISDELFAVRALVNDNPELRSALADSSRTLDDRSALLTGVLGTQVQAATVTLIDQAVRHDGSVDANLADYQRVAADVLGEMTATVRSARPLADADLERLASVLGRQYDIDVHLNLVVEPSLVGGLRVEIGDDVIDGTVSGRLDEARRRLVG